MHAPGFDAGLDEAPHERGLCLLRGVIDAALHRGDRDAQAPRIVRENVAGGLPSTTSSGRRRRSAAGETQPTAGL